MADLRSRLRELMDEHGHDQVHVAEAVGVTQGAISLILLGKTKRSRHTDDIADFYGVSARWLRGQDVPKLPHGEGSPPIPKPSSARVFLEVRLPSEDALAEMFEALLLGIDQTKPLAEQARLLAQSLPTGLSVLRDVRPPRSIAARAPTADPEQQAPQHREHAR